MTERLKIDAVLGDSLEDTKASLLRLWQQSVIDRDEYNYLLEDARTYFRWETDFERKSREKVLREKRKAREQERLLALSL